MKLPPSIVGSIAEITAGMYRAGGAGLDVGQVGKMLGAVVRSREEELSTLQGIEGDDFLQCVSEGERLGKYLGEFFQREEGG